MTESEAWRVLNDAEEIVGAAEVRAAVQRVAAEIRAALKDRHPLVLSVMGGAVVFTGHLLPLLDFPLDFETIHVTRYGAETRGGELVWRLKPRASVRGRTVLIVDDILDEGRTLAEIRAMVSDLGAAAIYTAVFSDKKTGAAKPIEADFVGLELPNRFVFGFGMDISGAWRNLPAIFALKEENGDAR